MINSMKVLRAGLLVGTLDILAACIQYTLNTRQEPSAVLRFIASGVFGTDAFSGSSLMVVAGIIFHYIIALGFSYLFFMIYPKLNALFRNNILSGIFYGIFIWCVMSFIIVPLSNTPALPFSYSGVIISILILICCIGIPLALIAGRIQRQGNPG